MSEIQQDGALIFAAKDRWFMFHTYVADEAMHLEIYRSIQLPEDDVWLASAHELLNGYPREELSRETVLDPQMIMGRAERVVYRLPVARAASGRVRAAA